MLGFGQAPVAVNVSYGQWKGGGQRLPPFFFKRSSTEQSYVHHAAQFGPVEKPEARVFVDRASDRRGHHPDHRRDRHSEPASRQNSRESGGGVSNIRTITSATIVYSSTYDNGLPPTLASLGGIGVASCNGAILLDDTLTTPPYHKSGYAFDYQPQGAPLASTPPGCAAPGFNEFLTTSVPVVVGQTGQSSYCSDEPGVIRINTSGIKAASLAACEALPPLQ